MIKGRAAVIPMVNKYGVIEGGERIVLINKGNRSVAIVTIVEYENRWYFGISMRWGVLASGAGGCSFAPSIHNSGQDLAPQLSRQGAIKKARE